MLDLKSVAEGNGNYQFKLLITLVEIINVNLMCLTLLKTVSHTVQLAFFLNAGHKNVSGVAHHVSTDSNLLTLMLNIALNCCIYNMC